MPRKSFRGKSMRPDKGVVVDTETIVKYRKKARPGKRMVFGSIRARGAEEKEVMEEARPVRQRSLDDYILVQKRIEDFKRYRERRKKVRKEKSLEKRKGEEAAEIVEMVREEMQRPGAVRIREPWREESLPYKVKKKMQEEFPVVTGKLGKVKAAKKSEEIAAAAYDKIFKEEEETKKKKAKKGEKLAKFAEVRVKDVAMLLAFLLALVLFFAVISWITSMF